jgi:spore coat polysaccharide biosynthesis protein SpsF
MDIHGKPLLQRLMERLEPSTQVDQWVIVTTTNSEDDALATWCNTKGYTCFRGSDWDVLDRFYQASLEFDDVESVVRICSDNPLHSYKVVDLVVNAYKDSGKTYFSNSNHEPDFLEDGFDTEVFSYNALKDAWENAKLLSEREHVCPYIKKHNPCGWKKANSAYDFKLSVDTLQDLEAVRAIYEKLSKSPEFSIEEVVDLLDQHPEILNINKDSVVNSGFQKTLKEDRIVK